MAFMAPVAIAGLALAAGGAAYNYAEKKKTQAAVKSIHKQAQKKIDANTAQAMGRWQESLGELTPEQQQALTDEKAAQRYGAFEEATSDVPEATNVMQTDEGSPAIVKSEAAKQLGTQLAQMKGMMQAKSRLGGWDDRGLATNIMLGRSGQDIAQLGQFSKGWANAATQDAALRAQQHKPIGDILMGVGSLMTMGAGMAGAAAPAAAGAAGAAGTAGAAGAGTAATAGASQGLGSTLLNLFPWGFNTLGTTYGWGQTPKPKPVGLPKPIGYTGAPVGVTVGASDTGIY